MIAMGGDLAKVICMITPRQIRAARVLLKWRQQDLADHAIVGVATVQRIEEGKDVRVSSLQKVEDALRAAGIEFAADSDGVRLVPKVADKS